MNEVRSTEELAVLFADIGGSTVLYQRVGDEVAHGMVTACLRTMSGAVEASGGRLLRTLGDAVLATFPTCDEAYLGALQIQQLQRDAALSVRVGFHWGAVIADGGDVYGHTVNVASRVASLANTNEIVTTEAVVERLGQAHKSRAALLDHIGVKGIATPLAVYRLRWQDESATGATNMFTKIQPYSERTAARELVLSHLGTQQVLRRHGDACSLGRDPGNAVRCAHNGASRHHATIECRHDKFVLQDVSTNGTYVVRTGQPFAHVHRDTMTLEGEGVIGAGFLPDVDARDAVRFQIKASD